METTKKKRVTAAERKKMEAESKKREGLKEMERKYPISPIDQYITQRFVFEPRSQYGAYGGSWLVCKDRATGKYVMETTGVRGRMMRFRDSWEGIQYLRKRYIGEKGESK